MTAPISRRTLLRGLGASMGLPLLEAMSTNSHASSPKPPVRVGWVFLPNGVVRESWKPEGEGCNFKFNKTSSELEPVREHITMISNLAHDKARPNGDGPGAHGRCGATYLTAVQAKKTEGKDIFLGESIDQAIARQVGTSTRSLPSNSA